MFRRKPKEVDATAELLGDLDLSGKPLKEKPKPPTDDLKNQPRQEVLIFTKPVPRLVSAPLSQIEKWIPADAKYYGVETLGLPWWSRYALAAATWAVMNFLYVGGFVVDPAVLPLPDVLEGSVAGIPVGALFYWLATKMRAGATKLLYVVYLSDGKYVAIPPTNKRADEWRKRFIAVYEKLVEEGAIDTEVTPVMPGAAEIITPHELRAMESMDHERLLFGGLISRNIQPQTILYIVMIVGSVIALVMGAPALASSLASATVDPTAPVTIIQEVTP